MLLMPMVDLIEDVVRIAFKALSKRHAIGLKYLIDSEVEIQFSKCIHLAINAFTERYRKYKNYQEKDAVIILDYFKSKIVGEEISKLLDPGFEIFDIDLLVSNFEDYAEGRKFDNFAVENIRRAWDDFLRAFSFASRSAPGLREFLRASYEAGSFRALSNIGDMIETIGKTLGDVNIEENRLKSLISEHSDELYRYRAWADDFSR